MNKKEIREYAELMSELNLTGLEITEGNQMIRLEMPDRTLSGGNVAVQKDTAPKTADRITDGCVEVKSPMVGLFYSSPSENADPYVKVGDSVKEGDVLCIIEAMKLMNEVVAECDGVILEICVKNNQTVDYGTVLFRIGE